MHEGDVAAQADYTLQNVLQVVEAAGGSAGNIVKTVEYVTPAALLGTARSRACGHDG